jgi:hypothetical protein
VAANTETQWIVTWIRWEQDSKDVYNNDDEEEDDEPAVPTDTFSFRNLCPEHDKDSKDIIDIELRGFQSESEQMWNSTGLTLWHSLEQLCDYLVENVHMLQPKKHIAT